MNLNQKFEIWLNTLRSQKTTTAKVARYYMEHCEHYHLISDVDTILKLEGQASGAKNRLCRLHGFKFENNPNNHYQFKLVDIDLEHEKQYYYGETYEAKKNTVEQSDKMIKPDISSSWRLALGLPVKEGSLTE